MAENLKNWLAWRGLKWNRLNAVKRQIEVVAMKEYYAANPPVSSLKAKYRSSSK